MRIAIMGSGGVGGYVGAWLQQAGQDVHFIARGAHLAALRSEGLRIEHPQLPLQLPPVQASDDPAAIGPVDLVIFAVKLFDTEAAARQMAPLVGPETRVLTLQNGIDSVAMIRAQLGPAAQVRGGVIYVSAVIERPGVIRSPGGLHSIVADSAQGDPVMAALQQAAADLPGLEIKLSEHADLVIWEKFVVLAAVSGATTLLRARLGAINGHPEARAFLRQLVDESIALAQARGVGLRAGLADEVMARIGGMPPAMRSSMSEDLERGNRLELGWLSGRVHALGLELGVPTPAHSAVYRGLVLYENGAPAAPL
ncbi:ketopantoate reductase family protein [Aquabacterium sp.]|uniref:ketopantoate reductase family protein n=1 Tax=Aquabacterium sp. TaxID=1872578 RepID=UPI0037830571